MLIYRVPYTTVASYQRVVNTLRATRMLTTDNHSVEPLAKSWPLRLAEAIAAALMPVSLPTFSLICRRIRRRKSIQDSQEDRDSDSRSEHGND